MADDTKLNFDTSVNYMKRSSISDMTTITLGSLGSIITIPVNHNLGYIPDVYVAYDPAGNGIVFGGDKINAYTDTSLSGASSPPDPQLNYWTTKNTLTIEIINSTTPTATGTRDIFWIVYLDYGDR